MKIAICAVTYRRPEGLRRLLEGLNALVLPDRTSHRLHQGLGGEHSGLERCGRQVDSHGVEWGLDGYRKTIQMGINIILYSLTH